MKRALHIIMLMLAVCSQASAQQTSVNAKTVEKITNGYEYVDLGLSVMWATKNMGANSPTDCGKFYAWGETKPKKDYAMDNYEFFCQTQNEKIEGTYINGKFTRGYTKYVSEVQAEKQGYDGYYDNRRLLDFSDDAARVVWGGKWCIPTLGEMNELCTQCVWTWTEINGKWVYKITGPNGNYIILPAGGACFRMKVCYANEDGFYWTANAYTGAKSNGAYILHFNKTGHGITENETRYDGRVIRPVIKMNQFQPRKPKKEKNN